MTGHIREAESDALPVTGFKGIPLIDFLELTLFVLS